MADSGPNSLAETAVRVCRLNLAALAVLMVVAGCGGSAPAPATAPATAGGGVRTVGPAQPASSDGSVEPPTPPANDPPPDSPTGNTTTPRGAAGGNTVPGGVANPAEIAGSLTNLGVRVVSISDQDDDAPRIAVYLDTRHVTDQGMIRPNVLPGIGQVPNMVLVLDRTRFSAKGLYGLRPVSYTHQTLPTICSV